MCYGVGPPVAHGIFDPTPRDADVGERAIVELMELADGAAPKPFIGQVARQPSAPRAESAEPLRQPAHGAVHAGFDDKTVGTGLPLGLQEQGQGQGIISIERGGSAGDRFSQQGRKFNGAERGCTRE
jgi:hypothetical protein